MAESFAVPVEIKVSEGKGLGLFAVDFIPKGGKVYVYEAAKMVCNIIELVIYHGLICVRRGQQMVWPVLVDPGGKLRRA